MLLSYIYDGCTELFNFDGTTTYMYRLKIKECSWWGYGKPKIKILNASYMASNNRDIEKQLDSRINKWY
jgi:hypothetical protein